MEHTPGPWKREVWHGIHQVVTDANGEAIAFDVKGWANANLFAAAPDLLAACRGAMDTIERLGGERGIGRMGATLECLDAAIAKVEGE